MLEIAIPVYNEERRLAAGLDKLIDFRKQNNLSFLIAIADNGSVDETRKIAESYCQKFDFIKYIHVEGKGVGKALKKVWFNSKAELVGYLDVDHSTDLRHLLQVVQLFQDPKINVISGSRLIPGAQVINRKWTREVSSRGFNFLLKALLSVQFTDGMCGFKFFRRSVIQKLQQAGVDNDQWFFNTQILVKAEWLGYTVTEIPVHWTDDPDSKAKILNLAVEYLKAIYKLKAEKKGLPRVHSPL